MLNIIQYCLLYLNMERKKNESKIEKIELTGKEIYLKYGKILNDMLPTEHHYSLFISLNWLIIAAIIDQFFFSIVKLIKQKLFNCKYNIYYINQVQLNCKHITFQKKKIHIKHK